MSHYPIYFEEQTKHGNASFPCSIYLVDAPIRNKEKIYCHWHKEVELLYILKGKATLTMNHRVYEIKEKDFIWIPVNQIHMVVGDTTNPFQFVAIVFHPDFISSFANDIIQQKYISSLLKWEYAYTPVFHKDSVLQSCVSRLLDLWKKKENGYELYIKAVLYEIICHLYEIIKGTQMNVQESNDYRITQIKQMISYIQKHYDENISLDFLANHFSLSKGHICRIFKDMTHMTMIDYLNYYRINRSAQLLQESDATIISIAESVGFHNISYFNRTFKKYMHHSPKEYRFFQKANI